MDSMQFNPFEDRLSRDIRNDLSETVIELLESGSITGAEEVAAGYRRQNLAAQYLQYIDERLKRYGLALEILSEECGLLDQAAVFWDLELFFEVHEILEPAWMEAKGDQKRLLQALIRAAGVYINLELGYEQRAAKINTKALPVIKELKRELIGSIDGEALVAALERLSVEPPRLRMR
ncbi:MAG: DUF309 domain-containing protein [Desulfobulbaceae bacterium]|nr:MAG: DUF309 domain-containing protein [Desulfobulbaceae bacterium]